jgi:polysaccharide biosynthesis transport protein
LRNPSLSRMLGYDKDPGLINAVADRLQFEELVISDSRFKFDVLPSSATVRPSNSSDVLNAAATRAFLQKARSDYDYIVCDLPPVLPVVDVKAAAGLFDAFILVVEWGSTSIKEIRNAVEVSPLLSERLLGGVLNKADEALLRRFEGYSDRRYSYYGKAAEG